MEYLFRSSVYQTANFAMVEAYWQIRKSIIEEQKGEERAEYGSGLLKELSKQMTQDFGKGFTVSNLKNMRQLFTKVFAGIRAWIFFRSKTKANHV